MMKKILKIILISLVCSSARAETVVSDQVKIDIKDGVLKEGQVKFISIEIPTFQEKVTKVEGKIFNLKFLFFESRSKPNQYHALISPPLGVAKGDYTLEINLSNGAHYETKVAVENKIEFQTTEVIDTPEASVLPKQEKIVERLSKEDINVKHLFMKITDQKYWKHKFYEPVKGKINSPFGIYRIYSNHLRRRTHWGIDYSVGVGTKVYSSSDGVVVFANSLYFPGKTIVIDHGLGVYTGYTHLSKMNVKVGDRVSAKQLIGLSGISGKASGPLLHWMAVNSRVKVNPLSLLDVEVD